MPQRRGPHSAIHSDPFAKEKQERKIKPMNNIKPKAEKIAGPREEKTSNMTPEENTSGDYLDGAAKKYPFKVQGRISCNLLKAAIVRSAQDGNSEVNKKARDLFDDNC